MDIHTERVLRERIAVLEEECREYRHAMRGSIQHKYPLEWKLTRLECKLIDALMSAPNGGRSYQALHIATLTEGRENETDPEIIRVVICNLRRKLTPLNIVIDTIWGFGYELTDQSRIIIRIAMNGQKAAVAA